MTTLVSACGERMALAVDRWRADVAAMEWSLLDDLRAPVLDIGCGPGRVPVALAQAGRPCLGIDTAPAAVAEARRRGAAVLCRSVFDPLPGEGRWGSAVMLDGSIGIGGDPAALLSRVADLLARDGCLLAELASPGSPTRRLDVRLEAGEGDEGPWFPWATVGATGFAELAEHAGLRPMPAEERAGRWFARAVRP